MRGTYSLDEVVAKIRAEGRIVIVGASLAGLRAAEALREKGFEGSLTIIGDEPHEPYDRPPLSKQVLKGWVPADHTKLPRLRRVDAEWKLGVAAVGLDRINHLVKLANGVTVHAHLTRAREAQTQHHGRDIRWRFGRQHPRRHWQLVECSRRVAQRHGGWPSIGGQSD